MRAMVFAAGLGTRLRPLTNDRPKALVEVGGMPLLEFVLRRLLFFGIREVVVNVHHFADQMETFLAEKAPAGMNIYVSDERTRLLETGGGLKNAQAFFQDGPPFLVYNVDVVTDLDLGELIRQHHRTGALATLAVKNRPSSRNFIFDLQGHLVGWRNLKTDQYRWCNQPLEAPVQSLAFSGVQVIDPDLFRYFPEEELVFSIVDVYLRAGAQAPIMAHRHDNNFWIDAGKIPALETAGEWVQKIPIAP